MSSEDSIELLEKAHEKEIDRLKKNERFWRNS